MPDDFLVPNFDPMTRQPLDAATPQPAPRPGGVTVDPGFVRNTDPGLTLDPGRVRNTDPGFLVPPTTGAPEEDFPDWLSQPKRPKYEPYIRPPLRPPSLWGKKDPIREMAARLRGAAPGPYMPQAQDVRGLLDNALGSLGKIGSGNVASLALSLRGLNAQVVNAYITGKMNRMRYLDAQQNQQIKMLAQAQTEESEAYGTAFELYADKPAELKRELERIADKYGDHDGIKAAIDRMDFKWVEKVNSARDHHLSNLLRITDQREKMKATEDYEEGIKNYISGKPATPAATPADPSATTSTATSPGAAAATTPTPAPSAATTEPPISQLTQDARDMQMDPNKVPASVAALKNDPRAMQALNAERARLDAQMRAIPQSVAPPGETDEARKAREAATVDQIRAINPEMADAVQGMLDDPARRPTATAADKPGDRMALNLAHKARPDFSRADAAITVARERARISEYRTDISRQLTDLSSLRRAIPRNVQDMDYLISLAEKTNRSGVPVFQRWLNAGKRAIAGDEDVTKFNTQLLEFRRDAGAILTTFGGGGRGQYTVYAQRHMEDFVDGGATPGQLRAMGDVLKRDYENLLLPTVGEINRLQTAAYGPGNFTPESANDVLAILRGGRVTPPMPSYRKVD